MNYSNMANHVLIVDRAKVSHNRQLFDTIKSTEGIIQVHIKEFSKSNTRYKYYFGYVLPEILKCGIWQIKDSDGNWKRCTNTTQLHELMKYKYNPAQALDPFTGEVITLGGKSTTELSDTEFIHRFTEQIQADHAGSPFYIEWMQR